MISVLREMRSGDINKFGRNSRAVIQPFSHLGGSTNARWFFWSWCLVLDRVISSPNHDDQVLPQYSLVSRFTAVVMRATFQLPYYQYQSMQCSPSLTESLDLSHLIKDEVSP